MTLLKPIKKIFFFKNNSIECYDWDRGFTNKVEFPPNVFDHLQIISYRRFNSELVSFLSNYKPQKVLIILSPDIASIGKSLPEYVLSIFTRLKFKVRYIVPSTVFEGVIPAKQLTHTQTKTILKSEKLLKAGNLNFYSPNEKSYKNLYLLALSVLLILLFFLGFNIFQNKNNPEKPSKKDGLEIIYIDDSPPPSVQSMNSPSPTPSPSAVIKKSDIRIKVLNGSGVSGQAAKVKNELLEAGFLEIETGNASSSSQQTTLVEYGPDLPGEFVNEIKRVLEDIFKKVGTNQNPEFTGTDILITTGKN